MRRVLFNVWRVAERLGIRLATEGPTYSPTDAQCEEMDALVTHARAKGGVIDASSTAFPAHELLTHLVERHGLLLHGTNHTELDIIKPRPARDFGTRVEAVAAADDGIWPLFYAVVARERVEGVFTACMHLGRPPSLRRFYLFRVFGADPRKARRRLRRAQEWVPARVGKRVATEQRGNACASCPRTAERLPDSTRSRERLSSASSRSRLLLQRTTSWVGIESIPAEV
jgi:hypothetical protein